MAFFKRLGVYTKEGSSEASRAGAKVIKTKWVDTCKGDYREPNMRARLVGQEFKTDNKLDLFAGTPPLEAFEMVLSRRAANQ